MNAMSSTLFALIFLASNSTHNPNPTQPALTSTPLRMNSPLNNKANTQSTRLNIPKAKNGIARNDSLSEISSIDHLIKSFH